MTFLLTWNPKKFHWTDYLSLCEENRSGRPIDLVWSVCSRKMKAGDTCFLLMQGMGEKNGIVGYGQFLTMDDNRHITTDPSVPMHFLQAGGRSRFVAVQLSKLYDYHTDQYIRTSMLEYLFPRQCWKPQSSGIKMQDEIAEKLKKLIKQQVAK